MQTIQKVPLSGLLLYFLKLGTWGFGQLHVVQMPNAPGIRGIAMKC
jgi:hypothetical protein